jgi:hypothetical protein
LELDLGVGEESEPAFLYRLAKYLTQMVADETIAIIIDEAQNLREEVMQELQMFSNLEPKVIQVVLVGQPEFEDKLNSQGLSQFKQRIRIKRQIGVLTGEESMDYIDRRLRLVGRSSSQMFTPKAISMICSYAQGIPRMINILCDNAFLMSFNLSQKKIDVDIIREVIKDIKGPSLQKTILSSITTALREIRPSPIRLKLSPKKVSLTILSAICLGGLILLTQDYLQRRPANTWNIESSKPSDPSQPVTLAFASLPNAPVFKEKVIEAFSRKVSLTVALKGWVRICPAFRLCRRPSSRVLIHADSTDHASEHVVMEIIWN